MSASSPRFLPLPPASAKLKAAQPACKLSSIDSRSKRNLSLRISPEDDRHRARGRRAADGVLRQEHPIEYKGDADLVTAADRNSEKLIRERIRQTWPGHDVLGEEEGLRDTGSEFRWYVDPLDGTTNFAHGFPVFCVSMALQHKNVTVAGICFDPTRNEMFAAERGKGATLNDRPIHVSRTTQLKESLVGTGFPEPQAPQESQYPLLSPDHVADARRAARGIGSA